MISMPSSVRRPRSCRGMPKPSNCFGYSPPTPTPRIARPFESTSSVPNCFATQPGWCSGSSSTSEPIVIREVAAAAKQSVVNESWEGPRFVGVSPAQKPSKPSSSRRRANSPGVSPQRWE